MKIWNLKSDEEWTSTTTTSFAPTLSSDIEVICIPYILLKVVLCITLEPNGKLSGNFVWLDMGLPNNEKESNTLNTHPCLLNSNLCCLAIYIHLYSTLLNFQVANII